MEQEKKYQEVSENIEKVIRKLSENQIIFFGCVLQVFTIVTFIFAQSLVDINYIIGYKLFLQYNIISAFIFVIVEVTIIVITLIPRVPDKLRFATSLVVINLILYFISFVEIKFKISLYHDTRNLSVLSLFPLLFSLGLFGVGALESNPHFKIFIFWSKIYDRLQKSYDES